MNPNDILKACAELDGWYNIYFFISGIEWRGSHKDAPDGTWSLPAYTTSYDAIIPLIQKQSKVAQCEFLSKLFNMYGNNPEPDLDYMTLWPMTFSLTPAQLCEALLCALGLWEE